jgi:hypothetical protein
MLMAEDLKIYVFMISLNNKPQFLNKFDLYFFFYFFLKTSDIYNK